VYNREAINKFKGYCTEMRIQKLRSADDIAVIAQDEINLKRALECLDDIFKT
jgi:hypothetical protein